MVNPLTERESDVVASVLMATWEGWREWKPTPLGWVSTQGDIRLTASPPCYDRPADHFLIIDGMQVDLPRARWDELTAAIEASRLPKNSSLDLLGIVADVATIAGLMGALVWMMYALSIFLQS